MNTMMKPNYSLAKRQRDQAKKKKKEEKALKKAEGKVSGDNSTAPAVTAPASTTDTPAGN